MEKYKLFKASSEYAKRKYTKEHIDSIRNEFSRDRDRILFSKEFRRLQGKTQVFINGFDDHLRNRLTHTLEVSQISKTIARYFKLNSDLVEAIALSHDVGHTPFGHIGERVLNYITNNCDVFKDFETLKNDMGFKHNFQGVKVVTTLEKIDKNFDGLNLTDYTLWGILNHSKQYYKKCKMFKEKEVDNKIVNLCMYRREIDKTCKLENNTTQLNHYEKYLKDINVEKSWTIEGLIVSIADEIAQRDHDVEDGIIAGIINKEELVDVFKDLFSDFLTSTDKLKLTNLKKEQINNIFFHHLSGIIIRLYISELANNSKKQLDILIEKFNLKTDNDFNNIKEDIYKEKGNDLKETISFSNKFNEKDKEFQTFLYNRILNSHLTQTMDGKANYIIRNITQAYLTNPNQLPDKTVQTLLKNYLPNTAFKDIVKKSKNEKYLNGIIRDEIKNIHYGNSGERYNSVLVRTIVDFIAGMTDNYAVSQYKMLYGSDNYWGN